MVIVFSEQITVRMKYVFSLVFKEFMGLEVSFTSNAETFYLSSHPRINYSANKITDNEIHIAPHGLLFEMGVKDKDVDFVEYKGLQCPFKVYGKDLDYPFDLFAATFFLVSRYEEYLPYKKDEHGRFPVYESMAYKKGFLQFPVVDQWALDLKRRIQQQFDFNDFQEIQFQFIPTIDIDVAYAYKLRGLIRTSGGFVTSLLQLKLQDFFQRARVLLGVEKDPFDTYNYQLTLHKKYHLRAIYFILFADYDVNDKNINVLNQKFHSLIKSLGDYGDIGIHPSYNSFDKPNKMKKEIERLSKIINKEVIRSRQHFLRMNLPATYNHLDHNEIKEDYTMGYARHVGFRASISRPYFFYNLEMEMPTYLKIYPFVVMDGTLKDYMQLTPQQAEDTVKSLISRVKAVNGVFVSLWHNHSLSGQGQWEGWRRVYEYMLKEANVF
ncbi:MAG: polysaccharide deacetylase family protein [Bacteroidales bacterium]